MRRSVLTILLLITPTWGQATWKEFSIGPPTGKNTRTNRDRLQGQGVPFVRIVARAYGVPEYMIGGLGALADDRYAITALVNDPGDLQPLLQKELASRFHLAAHREKKLMPVYVLKTIPDQPNKLAPPASGSSSGDLRDGSFTLSDFRLAALASGLADFLSGPVLDETHLDGRYNIRLTWERGNEQSLQAAVRDQLGLQLSLENREMEMVLVDHVEKLGEKQ